MACCDEFAARSIVPGRMQEKAYFLCNWHWQEMRKPIPGIDRPAHADEYWRPSLTDMMKLASIHAAVASPMMQRPPTSYGDWNDRRYTPEQLKQVKIMRALMRLASQ